MTRAVRASVPSAPSGFTMGLIKRIYGSIFLLDTLNENLVDMQSPSSDSRRVADRDAKEMYQCFVNKLGHLCAVKHDGDSVTAAAILQSDCDAVEYVVTSNSRTLSSFKQVEKFLGEEILGRLGGTADEVLNDDDQVADLCSAMLLRVLAFNRWRIHWYIGTLAKHVGFCIDRCDQEGTPEAMSASHDLRSLRQLATTANDEWPDAVAFSRQSHRLLQAISDRYYQGLERLLRIKAAVNTRERDLTPWGHLRHAIGRLQSYSIAMLVLVEARRRWPLLFQGYKITCVPSAPRGRNPMQMKEDHCTGERILRCINADDDTFAAYRAFDQNLLGVIDGAVKTQIKSKEPGFYTLIHAEVNLLDHLSRQETPVQFFKEEEFGRYIGCSKPTCLLCDLFFDAHVMNVQRRRSHRNLYTKWRVPDDTHRRLGEDMAARLKKIVAQTINKKAGVRSRYDSSHNPSDPWRNLGGAGRVAGREHDSVGGDDGSERLGDVDEESEFAWEAGVEELDGLMRELDFGPSDSGIGDEVSDDVSDDGSDDELGGATL